MHVYISINCHYASEQFARAPAHRAWKNRPSRTSSEAPSPFSPQTWGSGGNGGNGLGGAVNNSATGTLIINPRLGAKKSSKQGKATDLITTNAASGGIGGTGTAAGSVHGGAGGSPGGTAGQAFVGANGTVGIAGSGKGGGLDLITGGTATIDNTTITANLASSTNNDVAGTFMM